MRNELLVENARAMVGNLESLSSKSDLRNHQAIVQPRLYDCLMVTQIALKTEGPNGLPSGRRTEVDPLYPGRIILAVYDCGHAFQSLERSEPVRERIDEKAGGSALLAQY
jgi:hypothetical protein